MIQATNLKKRYGDLQALKGISFHIREGEFYGLLGPNGAGKSTTISILSTLLHPDEGEISIAGIPIAKDPTACKRQIGVVPQEIALYDQLSAYDNLLFWGGLYGIEASVLKPRIDETLKMMGLFDRRKDKVKTYSGGMKRRINMASALLHQPKVLLMDEPTVGIDPQSRNLIFEVIENLHRQGMTMIYTTHYMEEAQRFCDRIGIIDSGTIIAEGTLDELRNASGMHETITVQCANLEETNFQSILKLQPAALRNQQEIQFITRDVQASLSGIVLDCTKAGLQIEQVHIQPVNLETIFLKLTGKQLRD